MEEKQAHEADHDHRAPVPRFLLLVFFVIVAFFVCYLFTGLRFGANSPTGF